MSFATYSQIQAKAFIKVVFFRLYSAGMNFVSIALTNMRSTLGTIRKNPVPIVKRGEQKQLFFPQV